jgi:hypothetical protein
MISISYKARSTHTIIVYTNSMEITLLTITYTFSYDRK